MAQGRQIQFGPKEETLAKVLRRPLPAPLGVEYPKFKGPQHEHSDFLNRALETVRRYMNSMTTQAPNGALELNLALYHCRRIRCRVPNRWCRSLGSDDLNFRRADCARHDRRRVKH